MKIKSLILLLVSILVLSSCSKKEAEHYESKKRVTKSVFDDIHVPNKLERERLKKEKEQKAKEGNKDSDSEEALSEIKPNEANPAETTEETPAVEETKPQDNQAANFVTSGNVNLRNQPVIEDGNIITTLEEGKEVTIIEENAGEDQTWVKVSVDGQEGYISREYLVAR